MSNKYVTPFPHPKQSQAGPERFTWPYPATGPPPQGRPHRPRPPWPRGGLAKEKGARPGMCQRSRDPSARRRLRRPVRPRCPLHAPRSMRLAPRQPRSPPPRPGPPRARPEGRRGRNAHAAPPPWASRPGRKGRGARREQPGEGRPAAPPARHEPPREAGVARRPRRPPPPSGAAPSLPGSAPGHRPRPHSPAEPSSSHSSHMAPRRPPRKLRGCSASPARRSLRRGAAVRGPARGRARGWHRRRRPAPLGGRAHPRLPPPGPHG
uniref:basic salivary proline-rich protein 1-like n=1 Tax=Agelaius phoeniceus TaxID=39638 RepID=UPI0023EB4272|nr:basic salivary proline-rich protein 1-like [Agelaius phoeniceus]